MKEKRICTVISDCITDIVHIFSKETNSLILVNNCQPIVKFEIELGKIDIFCESFMLSSKGISEIEFSKLGFYDSIHVSVTGCFGAHPHQYHFEGTKDTINSCCIFGSEDPLQQPFPICKQWLRYVANRLESNFSWNQIDNLNTFVKNGGHLEEQKRPPYHLQQLVPGWKNTMLFSQMAGRLTTFY